MAHTEQPATLTTKQRIRRFVSPEIAANVREEDEALAATIATAQALVNAVTASATSIAQAATAKRNAALRPILRQLAIDEADVLAIEGFGAATTLVLDVPAPFESASAAPAAQEN